MHIVHIIARLNDGGPARVLADLARMLAGRGHRVTIIAGTCAQEEADLTAAMQQQGLVIETIPSLGRRVRPWEDVRAFAALLRRLRVLRPDVVHTHTAKAGALGRLACRELDLPCLHTYHGHVLHGYFSSMASLLLQAAERGLAGSAHHQALTPGQYQELHGRYGIGRPQRWHVLPIPVRPPGPAGAPAWRAQLIPGVPVIGFLGRLVAVKDPHLWLEAVATLARQRPVQGLMCGEGELRASVQEHARRLGVPVLFTGSVPAGEALAACTLLLMSSRNEGLPLVAVEAGWAGVPVVAPAVGGLADLIKSHAVEAAVRTPGGLATACARLLADHSLREARTSAGLALAQSLHPEALAPRYDLLYCRIASGQRTRGIGC